MVVVDEDDNLIEEVRPAAGQNCMRSLAGQRMAKTIAEWCFMRAYFEDLKDKKRWNREKEQFLRDM